MKNDDRRKETEAKGVTRRTFVQVGAAGLAIAAAPRVLARPETEAESRRSAGAHPERGAIFCTRYAVDGRGWEGVRSAPALGQYSSGDTGALDTHIVLAKKYGLSFFLAESATDDRRDYRTRNLERLYERSDLHSFRTAVLLSGFAPGRTPVAGAADGWLATRLQKLVSSGILEHDSYLRDTTGRAIVAVRADSASGDVAAAARRLFDGTDLHESMWLWVIGDGGKSGPANLAAGIAWVAQPQPTALRDALRQGEVSLLALSAETRGADIPADRLSAYSRSRYIVIDSFNDWKRRTALEPTARDRSRSVYVASLGKQLDSVVR